jgi:transcriptional regulator with XRE-family HTH domain
VTSLSKSAFARQLGVTPGRISQYIRNGMPQTWDGRVNTVEAERWIAKNVGVKPRAKARAEFEPLKRTSSYRTVGNKAAACRVFRMTRGEFDRLILEGMPIVSMPSSKGGEYVVDFEAVESWLAEREASRQEAKRRYQEADARREAELQRTINRMSEEQRRRFLPPHLR